MNARAEIYPPDPTRSVTTPEPSRPHQGRVIRTVEGYDVVDCASCGFIHVLPLPTSESLAQVYAQDYYSSEKPDYLARASADEDWARLFYDDRLDLIAAALSDGRRRLLEIGSGPGHFLARAAAGGWTTTGVEPSRQAAVFARSQGLSIKNDFFDNRLAAELACEEKPFDALHMMNVIEHVPDPAGLLFQALSLLGPGGVVCVGVPNDFNPLQRLLHERRGQAPWWVAPPHHLNYFSFESLERLLIRLGLRPIARTTSFPMELFAALGRNYIGNDALGRECHALRKAFDQDLQSCAPNQRRALYQALAQAGFGREAVIIAVKP